MPTTMREFEAMFASAIDLAEPARSAALTVLAQKLRFIAWSGHTAPIAAELARVCDSKVDPSVDLLAGMDLLARGEGELRISEVRS